MSITLKIIQKQENKTTNGYSSSSSMYMYQLSMPFPNDADEHGVYLWKVMYVSEEKKMIILQK